MSKSSPARPFLIALLFISAFQLFGTLVGDAQETMEEFSGPYLSWANIKTRFHAKGDGKTDDTKAFQEAFDSLSGWLQKYNLGQRGYTVVYIPRGTYLLSSTLHLKGKMGIKVVGEDPNTTRLIWKGTDADTMFWADGSAYFSLSRLQWDAGGRKDMEAVGMHWKQAGNGTYAPEEVEFADLIFNPGFKYGIHGGTYGGKDGTGMNESEITIKRCVFNQCTESAILITGFNALDYWIWFCKFKQCRVGVTSSSGNYHVYKSYFDRSSLSDVYNINSYYTSVRFCYSTGSAAFSREDGGSSNPFKRIFEGNYVTGIGDIGILYTHTGRITLIDNTFIAGSAAPSVERQFLTFNNSTPNVNYGVLNLNNNFINFEHPFNIKGKSQVFSSSVKNIKKGASRVNEEEQFLQDMPSTPLFVQHVIFDVPANSSTGKIQKIINDATRINSRAIVHFPFGTYSIDQPLVLPLHSDIQLEGDGHLYASILQKVASDKAENGAVFKVMCPTTVSMKDLDLELTGSGKDNGRAIVLFNADQKGGLINLDQLYAGNDTSLLIGGYDYTVLQKTNCFFTAGNAVSGGNLTRDGKGTFRVQCFGGQFAGATLSNNASFLARDCWWEGATSIPVNLSGSGNFAIDGAMVAPRKQDSSVVLSVNKFSGKVLFMDMYIIGSMFFQPENRQLEVLGWNLTFYHKKRPLAFLNGSEKYRAFFSGISTMCFNEKDSECASVILSADRSVNVADTIGFMSTITQPLRSVLPIQYRVRAAGATNFYLSRVAISTGYRVGIACL